MASPRPEWVEYATDREFGLGMIVADSSRLELSFLLDSDSQVRLFFCCFKSHAVSHVLHGMQKR